jgi:hypothetical protein
MSFPTDSRSKLNIEQQQEAQMWNLSATSGHEQSFPLREGIVSMYAGRPGNLRGFPLKTTADRSGSILRFLGRYRAVTFLRIGFGRT